MFEQLVKDSFNRFKIYKAGKEIEFKTFEEKFWEYTIQDETGNHIFVIPKDNDYILLTLIIYNTIKISYQNIFQSENDILNLVNIGDMVQYEKKLCKLIDKDTRHLTLKFKDGKIKLPLNLRYKLNKYNGEATVLNKMPNKPMNSMKKTKNLLAEIMDINIDEMCKVNKKTLLIIENKQRINHLIKLLEIKIGDNPCMPLTEVFPMAYYSNEDNIYYYRGNSNKEDPIIKFTSKTYIANALCKKIKSINSVIFLPKKITDEDLGDLKEIERKKNIKKIISIISPTDLERQISNEYLHEDFVVKSLKIAKTKYMEETFFNIKQLNYYKNYEDKNIVINNATNVKVNILRKSINKICFKLSKLFVDDTEMIKYIISARKFTKRLVSIPIPINAYNEIMEEYYASETIESLMSDLEKNYNSLLNRNISYENKGYISKVYSDIKELKDLIINKNLKWEELKIAIKSNSYEKTLIINDNKFIRLAIEKYLKRLFPYKNNIIFGTNNNIRNTKSILFSKIIFTGLLEDNIYNNYANYYSKQSICIFYQFEKSFFSYLKRKYDAFLGNINLEASIIDEDNITSTSYIEEAEEIENDLQLDIHLEDLITIGYIPNVGRISSTSQTLVESYKILKFIDGNKAFITKQFNAYELDEEKEEIIIRKPNELNIGQVLLFIDDIERDIVEKTIKDLFVITEIQNIYQHAYEESKKWKIILKNYMETNKISYGELSIELRKYGVDRSSVTIRSWITDAIVGPQEEDIYKALASMIEDEYLLKNYSAVYNSCNLIRSFQIKVKKAIAKSLLRVKSREGIDEIDEIIIDNCSNLLSSVVQVEIKTIYDIKKEVPAYLTNIVLEE